MTEFVVRLADERGKVQEQTHAAATAEELRNSGTPLSAGTKPHIRVAHPAAQINPIAATLAVSVATEIRMQN